MKVVAGRYAGSKCRIMEEGLYIEAAKAVLRFGDMNEARVVSSGVGRAAKGIGMWLGSRVVGGLLLGPIGYLAASTAADSAYSPGVTLRMLLTDESTVDVNCSEKEASLITASVGKAINGRNEGPGMEKR